MRGKEMQFGAVIVAAGHAVRMGGRSKVLMELNGRTVLAHTLAAFQASAFVREIVVVARAEENDRILHIGAGCSKLTAVVTGGKTRQESVFLGIDRLGMLPFYLIHDAARPLVSVALIDRICEAAYEYGAAAPAVPVTDTIKKAKGGFISKTISRDRLYAIQTPQAFASHPYQQAKALAEAVHQDYTDDCQLLEAAGHPIYLAEGDPRNIKLTTIEDLAVAKAYLNEDEAGDKVKMRIGYGYDVHRLAVDRKLMIGGVEIPHTLGLEGHSDADVLLHAVADALLGAAGLGDIGTHFPDTDPAYHNADSLMLLANVVQKLAHASICNIDATIMAQKPKLAPYIPQMKHKIAEACKIGVADVNIKATTEERLGFTGREEGIAASAVALIEV